MNRELIQFENNFAHNITDHEISDVKGSEISIAESGPLHFLVAKFKIVYLTLFSMVNNFEMICFFQIEKWEARLRQKQAKKDSEKHIKDQQQPIKNVQNVESISL